MARSALHFGTLHTHWQPLAIDTMQEGLGKGAHDGGHVLGLTPVVQVPPDAIARVHDRVGRSLGGLDAVDVIEPVGWLPMTLPPGATRDALHEAAAKAGADGVVAHQQAHRRFTPTNVGSARLVQYRGTEIARDRQLHSRRSIAGPEAAA